MNYIHQINGFWDRVRNKKDLKPTSVVVYLALLQINNKCGWLEKFTVPLLEILNMVTLNHKTYYSALNELSAAGYIVWKKGQNDHQAGIFTIPLLYQNSEEQWKSKGTTKEEQWKSGGNIHKPVNNKTPKPINENHSLSRAQKYQQRNDLKQSQTNGNHNKK